VRVSQRIDYALRGLVSLAQRPAGTAVAAGTIADTLMLPRRFLEQQFTALAQAGIVECRRGAGGGCALARPAEEITVGDVVRALEGVALDVPRTSGTVVSEMWGDIARTVEDALARVTLEELVRGQDRLDASTAAVYYI
jgi:Rrf2 family iron-sulfur cluster assembly transcriptional regulator